MSKLYGCTLTPFRNGTALLDWVVRGQGNAIPEATGTQWLLAHCDDGVTWGRCEQDKWKLSSKPFSHISPELSSVNLQQLRLFGAEREILIWCGENGFQGRILADTGEQVEEELRPKEESQILIGDRLLKGPCDGFSLVGEAGGSRHAVPLCCDEKDFEKDNPFQWPLRLVVKHYMSQDAGTGVVRIAASRLVNVRDITKGKK